jgi:molybdopterin biosynthesis enzyme MoaB
MRDFNLSTGIADDRRALMCGTVNNKSSPAIKTIPVQDAVGTVLAHDISEIRPGEFKGRAFKKGHIIRSEDICHLRRLGKERLFVLDIAEDEMHENDAAYLLAEALRGEGIMRKGEPKEGKINLVADRDGILEVRKEALLKFNMLGDFMCATLHHHTLISEGQVVAATRAIPLVVKRNAVREAVRVGEEAGKIIHVKGLRKPKAGIVITGNEVYYGRIKDSFAPIITKKILAFGGEVIGIYYAPDDESFIESRLRELMSAGADLLITTGGMSVDPDDVTRFAIRNLGALDITYGSAVLPGAMFLVAYISLEEQKSKSSEVRNCSEVYCSREAAQIPILGIPACGIYSNATVFDLILPRVLADEKIGRKELAEIGHGGLCLKCEVCMYPVCPFGK